MAPPLNVLILEDNQDDVDLVLWELRKANLEFVWQRVENAESFSAALNPNIDIILADFSLPQFSATQALKLLRQSGLDIPFVIVSGSVSEEIAVESMKQGASDYLLKDRLARLGQVVEHVIRERHLRHEKQQAEQAVQVSEARFRTIFNEALDAIFIVDGTVGNILDANPAIQRLLQYTPDQVIGRSFKIFFPQQQDADTLLEEIWVKDYVFLSQPFRRLDGSQIYMDLTASVIPWGKTQAILVTLRDVTERLEAEEARRANEALKYQLEKEKELRALKTRFISMLTHDFRNPLAAVYLAVSSLEMNWEKLSTERRATKFVAINEELQRMDALIEDILTIGKIESINTNFHPQRGDLHQFCQDLLAHLSETIGKQHQMSYEAEAAPLMMVFDESTLRRALTNLLSNAVKYSPQGSTVRLSLKRDKETIYLSVADEGIGIPEEDQGHLFEDFYRASNTDKIKGTGLGLAIVKLVAELHGGSIQVQSVVNKGSTFRIELPMTH